MKKITIIGMGYVGLPLALLAADKGHAVTGVDLDKDKVAKINAQHDPISDDFIAQRLPGSKLQATTTFDGIAKSDIVIICVPTPVKDGYLPDLEPLKSSVTAAAKKLSRGTLLIIESTINPGVSEEVVIPLAEEHSGLRVNTDFFVAHCPERINPGDKQWHVANIPRVVGASGPEGLAQAMAFYKSIIAADIRPMNSLKEAEAVKIVENSFRDINIAFVNELAKSFTKLGIDIQNVIRGAATKPFGFTPFYPGIGVGGHCIPVDPYYLIEYARGYGFEHEFLSLARSINNSMPEFTVDRLMDGLNEAGLALKGSSVTVLGLSYKANVADDRESPSYKVIRLLEEKGAKLQTYDPYMPEKSSAATLADAMTGADAIVLATNHKEFLAYDFSKTTAKVIIDGKNALDKQALTSLGLIYRGIGV